MNDNVLEIRLVDTSPPAPPKPAGPAAASAGNTAAPPPTPPPAPLPPRPPAPPDLRPNADLDAMFRAASRPRAVAAPGASLRPNADLDAVFGVAPPRPPAPRADGESPDARAVRELGRRVDEQKKADRLAELAEVKADRERRQADRAQARADEAAAKSRRAEALRIATPPPKPPDAPPAPAEDRS